MPESPNTQPDRKRAAADSDRADAQTKVLLAMLHGARRRGDRLESERVWHRIVLAELERVRGIARRYRSAALPGQRIPEVDIDEIAAGVFERLRRSAEKIEGTTVGELRSFMRTVANRACIDYKREHVRRDRSQGGSLDAGHDDGRGDLDQALVRRDAQSAADAAGDQLVSGLVHEALVEVDDDKRAILILDLAGYDTPEIAERLGISRDNVYQRRRRGHLQLADAIDEMNREDDDA